MIINCPSQFHQIIILLKHSIPTWVNKYLIIIKQIKNGLTEKKTLFECHTKHRSNRFHHHLRRRRPGRSDYSNWWVAVSPPRHWPLTTGLRSHWAHHHHCNHNNVQVLQMANHRPQQQPYQIRLPVALPPHSRKLTTPSSVAVVVCFDSFRFNDGDWFRVNLRWYYRCRRW